MTKRRIDRSSSVTYSEQLAEIIVEAIDEGRWRPGDLMLLRPTAPERTVVRGGMQERPVLGRLGELGVRFQLDRKARWFGSRVTSAKFDTLPLRGANQPNTKRRSTSVFDAIVRR